MEAQNKQVYNWAIVKNTISICKVWDYEWLLKHYLKDGGINLFINAVNEIGKKKVLDYYNNEIPKELKEVL